MLFQTPPPSFFFSLKSSSGQVNCPFWTEGFGSCWLVVLTTEQKFCICIQRVGLKVSLAAKFLLFLTCSNPPSSKGSLGVQFRSRCRGSSLECETDASLRCCDVGAEVVQDRSRSAAVVRIRATREMDKENVSRGVNKVNLCSFWTMFSPQKLGLILMF